MEQKDIKSDGIIAIPHTGSFSWWTVSALLGLFPPKGTMASWELIGNSLVYDAREKLVQRLYQENKDWILFLDSDMVPPPDMIEKMLAHNMPIVSGMAFKRIPPYQPCFYSKLDVVGKGHDIKPQLATVLEFPDTGIMKLEGVGLACCMIRREVFDMIEAPYFFPLPNLGEDLTFCYKVKQKQIPIILDLTIDVGHVSEMPVGKLHYKEAYKQYKAMEEKRKAEMEKELEKAKTEEEKEEIKNKFKGNMMFTS